MSVRYIPHRVHISVSGVCPEDRVPRNPGTPFANELLGIPAVDGLNEVNEEHHKVLYSGGRAEAETTLTTRQTVTNEGRSLELPEAESVNDQL